MKKFFYLMAMAIVSGAFTACSDDKNDSKVLSVDNSFVVDGITADIDGGFYDIPVQADYAWTATLEEGCDWATLITSEGTTSATVTLCVDPNYTESGRNSNLIISNGETSFKVPFRQRMADTNDDDYYNIASTKGLGFGLDLSKFGPGRVTVVNLKAVQKLIEWDDIEYGNLFVSNPRRKMVSNDVKVDSVENKKDSLNVSLNFNISYGLFHLGIKGEYVGAENRTSNVEHYKMAQTLPMLDAGMDYAYALSIYRQWVKDGKPSTIEIDGVKQKDYRRCIITSSVISKIETLEDYCNKDTTEAAIQGACRALYNDLGPGFIVGSKLGGMFALDLYIDKIAHDEIMHVNNATLEVNFKSGMFDLDADLAVTYNKDVKEVLDHSFCDADIKGGTVVAQEDIYQAFANKQFTELPALYRAWAATLKLSDNKNENTTELIDFDVVPIWVLTDNYKAVESLRSYVIEQLKAYKDDLLVSKFANYTK